MRGLLCIGWGPVIFIPNICAGNTQSHYIQHGSPCFAEITEKKIKLLSHDV
jgi:hypothetical protein